jgi:hypothetical protein
MADIGFPYDALTRNSFGCCADDCESFVDNEMMRECAQILRAPGARPYVPVDKDAALSEFEKIAGAIHDCSGCSGPGNETATPKRQCVKFLIELFSLQLNKSPLTSKVLQALPIISNILRLKFR